MGYYDTSYPPSVYRNATDPHITSLNPNTGSAAGGAIAITVTGTNFDASSVVEINQVAQPTTFVNATTLTVSYDPTVAGNVTFTVRRGEEESNSVTFVVGAADDAPEPTDTDTDGESDPYADAIVLPLPDDE